MPFSGFEKPEHYFIRYLKNILGLFIIHQPISTLVEYKI